LWKYRSETEVTLISKKYVGVDSYDRASWHIEYDSDQKSSKQPKNNRKIFKSVPNLEGKKIHLGD
jgi:hypothetical protein